jgi:hypothetical protein
LPLSSAAPASPAPESELEALHAAAETAAESARAAAVIEAVVSAAAQGIQTPGDGTLEPTAEPPEPPFSPPPPFPTTLSPSALVLRALSSSADPALSHLHGALQQQAASDLGYYSSQLDAQAAAAEQQAQALRDESASQVAALAARWQAARTEAAALRAALHGSQASHDAQLASLTASQARRQALEEARVRAHTLAALSAALLAERRARLEHLAGLRAALDGVSAALSEQRSITLRGGEARRLGAATLDVLRAAERGAPLEQPLRALLQAAEPLPGAELVKAVCSSLPADALQRGVPPRTHLLADFRRARQLSMQPDDGAGLLSRALAVLAAALRCNEDGSVPGGGAEAVLARAEASVREGRLAEAAAALRSAAPAATGLHASLLSRAQLDVATTALRAHAMAVAEDCAAAV